MKKRILFGLFLITSFYVSSQTCLPGGILFSTQAEITNFTTNYPGCTNILGDVEIIESVSGNITSLSGLSVLEQIGGNLRITDNSALMNLSGMNSLNTIEGSLEFERNSALNSISALSSVTTLNGFLEVGQNDALTSLNGLGGINSVGGGIAIGFNDVLADITALSNVITINGNLNIRDNDDLTSLSGLDNINHTGISNLILTLHAKLNVCEVQSICDYLDIPSNTADINNAVAFNCTDRTEVETACAALPVELISFYGRSTLNQIKLKWITASELNNLRYEIQNSNNGRDWHILDFVQGKGTSSSVNEYEYIDSNPFSGINYYRLKQIDYDGAFEFSKVIAVKFEGSDKRIQIFPNPSNRNVNIQIGNLSGERMKITVCDNLGRQVWESELIEGESNWIKELQIEGNGIYFIMAQIGNEVFYERVVILDEK